VKIFLKIPFAQRPDWSIFGGYVMSIVYTLHGLFLHRTSRASRDSYHESPAI
jgi:hypothetical protein